MKDSESQLTPMLRQYMGVKDSYPDAILFFRLGDFYEMFFDDARVASQILGITLTARGTLNNEKIPMCGVPYHSAKGYIAKLVRSGRKVAVCDQIGDPGSSSGIVKREVVRIVTPGSVIDEGEIEGEISLFIASLCGSTSGFGLAFADISTGEMRLTQVETWKDLLDELGRIGPAELLVPDEKGFVSIEDLSDYRTDCASRQWFVLEDAEALLKEHFSVASLAAFGCDDMPEAVRAAGALLCFIRETQRVLPAHIKEMITYRVGDSLIMDETTCTNLELVSTSRRQAQIGSLYQTINQTLTPMGGRLLRRWILYPLLNLDAIRERLGAVSFFVDAPVVLEGIRDALDGMGDIERLNGRISLGRANPRDLILLKASLERVSSIKERINASPSSLLSSLADALDPLDDIALLISRAIKDEPPVNLKNGGFIKEGYNEELDRLIYLTRDGKSWIADFAASEQERTGIPRLKVGYNRIYGYYIEVSKANSHLVPSDYIRKQTLVNCERYINESLKEMEDKVVKAEERRVLLEMQIFQDIAGSISRESGRIKDTASAVASIDVLGSFAVVSEKNNYTCPEVHDGDIIRITNGRHPVIEKTVKSEDFVPNDIYLDSSASQLLIITGPNMAGKSTILRQTALSVIMAQMGSFVPASKASIGITDRIFTRVGASDDLARGRSTFMVEMSETANILRNATDRSLVILDEIGRGTSTYDGMSIAWAVAEALHDRSGRGVRTLFATHFHELTELAFTKPRIKNYNVAVREWKDRIIFLRKMVSGAASRSYGIQCARIAGIPESVINRATEVLESLEGKLKTASKGKPSRSRSQYPSQMALFSNREEELRNRILSLDIGSMTPLAALNELNKLKDYLAAE